MRQTLGEREKISKYLENAKNIEANKTQIIYFRIEKERETKENQKNAGEKDETKPSFQQFRASKPGGNGKHKKWLVWELKGYCNNMTGETHTAILALNLCVS